MKGERNATRAEQLRARGYDDVDIARHLGLSPDAVLVWFTFQDQLLGTDEDGAA